MPFSKRDLFIAGLFLYLGEGTKTTISQLSVSNTNPAVINFFIKWLNEILNVPFSKMKIRLSLYKDMSVKKEIDFWSKNISIPKTQFRNPYIKATSSKSITYKNGFGHGTCNVIIGDARLTERILASLQVIDDIFGR